MTDAARAAGTLTWGTRSIHGFSFRRPGYAVFGTNLSPKASRKLCEKRDSQEPIRKRGTDSRGHPPDSSANRLNTPAIHDDAGLERRLANRSHIAVARGIDDYPRRFRYCLMMSAAVFDGLSGVPPEAAAAGAGGGASTAPV